MRLFKYAILAIAGITGLSVSASAQNNPKDPPPKKDPPVVVVKDRDKDKPKEKPKEGDRGRDNKPNKPEAYFDPTSQFLR